ncbi:hypothetical protein ACIRNY_10925 [Capnocytophaga canimorsus]|uniref:hypothetical protein n=1 Tax=Capnocytophaga canimorsus TaxID=28188 RepID=UPI00384D13E1
MNKEEFKKYIEELVNQQDSYRLGALLINMYEEIYDLSSAQEVEGYNGYLESFVEEKVSKIIFEVEQSRKQYEEELYYHQQMSAEQDYYDRR